MSTSDRHWTDEEIVHWVDEGATLEGIAADHLERCEVCRGRIAGIEALLSALGTPPPAATEAEMAAQRDRILAAVRSRPRARLRRLSQRSVWLPAVAAAAMAALILWAPRGTRSPGTAPTADSTSLPVIADATRAADEVAQAADDPETADRLVETPPLDLTQPDIDAPISEGWSETLEIEEEFAGLPAADREAILTELASVDFINDSEE